VYALNASTGAQLWSYKVGSYINSSPAVVNGLVYASSNYPARLYAFVLK
jgi:outer membrane protein assembly factor BamB